MDRFLIMAGLKQMLIQCNGRDTVKTGSKKTQSKKPCRSPQEETSPCYPVATVSSLSMLALPTPVQYMDSSISAAPAFNRIAEHWRRHESCYNLDDEWVFASSREKGRVRASRI